MTDHQAQLLQKAYLERAKIRVHLAAHPDNMIVQNVGKMMLWGFNRVIAHKETKWKETDA